MKRLPSVPRPDWKQKVESVGLAWHSNRGDYWNESAYYSFTLAEILKIEAATNRLHEMCLGAVQHVIDHKLYDRLKIPATCVPFIEASWNQEPPSLYGRFDLAYDGISEPKMLEYNADTPTGLVEAALAQWYWLQDLHPRLDQFNSLHEALIKQWKYLKSFLVGDTLHLASMDDLEDLMTVTYLRDCAEQAGIKTVGLTMPQIGMSDQGYFTDMDNRVIKSCFKLYPWEWMIHEAYGAQLLELGTLMQWIEPAWKMVLSNKGILAVLWELHPDHENLLPATLDEAETMTWEALVKKPLLSREGANVTVTMFDQPLATSPGEYGEEGYVYQSLAVIPMFEGHHPVLGSWIIGQEAHGMGIRESNTLITDNLSQFVPHLIEG